ncbi:MAG: methyltransferase domain-containing protein [Bryobacteraceae bacterium]
MPASTDPVLERELAYYERLYGSYGVRHFAQPAVVEFRKYLVRRIRRFIAPDARVLSIGCGIGDTELLLAPYVAHVTGVDLSPTAIAEANRASARSGLTNVLFLEGAWQNLSVAAEPFDVVLSIFFLHHLPDPQLESFPSQLESLLGPGGLFYALEPSARRLSGFVGKLVVPRLMKKYQTPDERPLLPIRAAVPFRKAGFQVTTRWFDFLSTPLAGLFPAWPAGYRLSRRIDDGLTALPGVRALSSNFELIAQRPRMASPSST